jgi:hypothetical protein
VLKSLLANSKVSNRDGREEELHFAVVRMGNLPALLPKATPPVSRFFGEMSNKRQF